MEPAITASFVLKKIIGTLLMPVPLTLLLMILTLFWLKRAPRKAAVSLVAAVLLLGLSCWPPLADQLIRFHTGHYAAFDLSQPVDAVVILGSASFEAPEGSPAHMQLGASALHRLLEGLAILQANPQATLLVSGYGGLEGYRPHALRLRDAAIDLGVDPGRIHIFETPVDTEDEARQMTPYLQGKRFALVTGETHLRRALRFFEQQGLTPLAAPAVIRGDSVADWRPGSGALENTERAIYEWLGLIWQNIKGVFSR
ncbi:MAG TPA: hypothetical protein DEA26_00110 [Oceanospirillales bacterium]|nr:hypothetical protein [Oceanospirillaceae bacterium]HBS41049.1 hypothetical protein [Oceanospirillales bacterium]|tara:strand:+ start:633 stop:1400 length:768 start_codon:yes stop_codon:yes gene_type:complete